MFFMHNTKLPTVFAILASCLGKITLQKGNPEPGINQRRGMGQRPVSLVKANAILDGCLDAAGFLPDQFKQLVAITCYCTSDIF